MSNKTIIDSHLNEYVEAVFSIMEKSQLARKPQELLNFAVHLILNETFQSTLKVMRTALTLPQEGLGDSEIDVWKKKFRTQVLRHHKHLIVPKATANLINNIEKKMGGSLADLYNPNLDPLLGEWTMDMGEDALIMSAQIILENINLNNSKNIKQWQQIIKNILTFKSPNKLLDYLNSIDKKEGEQHILIQNHKNRVDIILIMYPDATFEDVERLIESQRYNVSKKLAELKVITKKNKLNVKNIKRDYFIYKTHLLLQSEEQDNKYINRKDNAIQEQASKLLTTEEFEEIDNLDWKTIRKIINRTKERINETIPRNHDNLDKLISELSY